MPQLLMTIEQYIADVRKKDTLFIVFNSEYADAAISTKMTDKALEKESVNWGKREKFIQFMKKKMPEINIVDVFDNVPLWCHEWPFLGTIAIDVNIDSPQYNAICNQYEDENGERLDDDAVLFIMSYEVAHEICEKHKEMME